MSIRSNFFRTLATLALFWSTSLCADEKAVRVGVPTVLSGDFAILGDNIRMTIETYQKHYLRHRIEFAYEDAKLSSVDGLSAYQKLISVDHVDLIASACTSNATMAAKAIINSSKTPTLTIATGGDNIDAAGRYVFRIGNSDAMNGTQQAELLLARGQSRVALLTEETDYTQSISRFFRTKMQESGGVLVYDENFTPGTTDFRSFVTKIKATSPQAIFMPTQTGSALGVFLTQWHAQSGSKEIPVHTTFVAAPNPDAHRAAGRFIIGVGYMAPRFDDKSDATKRFFELFRKDHGIDPPIGFHAAGMVDALDMLQIYLDKKQGYDREKYTEYLLNEIKDFKGLKGTYSFDKEGNAALGFVPATIDKLLQ